MLGLPCASRKDKGEDHPGASGGIDHLAGLARAADAQAGVAAVSESLYWAARAEVGELSGRFHFHVLLAGMPENAVNPSTCSFFERVWSHQLKMGIADCRAWANGRDAVAYILNGEDFSQKGANAYEMGKFAGLCCQVTLSNSLLERRRIPEGE